MLTRNSYMTSSPQTIALSSSFSRVSTLQVKMTHSSCMIINPGLRFELINHAWSTPHQHIVPPTSDPSSSSSYIDRLITMLPPLNLHLPDPPIPRSETKQYPPFLPSAGLTRRLLTSLNESERPVLHGAITAWCVEGDNRGDAHALAQVALAVLDQGRFFFFSLGDRGLN